MLLRGNCLDLLKTLPENSVDSIVTDPPYELGFMGKSWDNSGIAYSVELWGEALRVLKPGGHLLAFGGSRTYHRLACAVEDAGFEIRDQIMYLYGSGFPKSLNVEKAAKEKVCQCSVKWSYGTGEPQAEREVRPLRADNVSQALDVEGEQRKVLLKGLQEQGVSTTGRQELSDPKVRGGKSGVEGRSNTQKDSWELQGGEVRSMPEGVDGDGPQGRLHHGASVSDGPMDRATITANGSGEPHQPQPLGQSQGELGTLPEQRRSQEGGSWPLCGRCGKPMVSGWGTALKPAHEPIVVARKPLIGTVASNVLEFGTGALNIDGSRVGIAEGDEPSAGRRTATFGTQETVSGGNGSGGWEAASGRWPANVIHDGSDEVLAGFPNDAGRFFYCAKASKSERNAGLEGLPEKAVGALNMRTDAHSVKNGMDTKPAQNFHPTVKPIALMRYLIKLVTPPGGKVLDPFLGSGSTAVAAILEGFDWLGCEMTEDYWPIIEARVEWAKEQPLPLI